MQQTWALPEFVFSVCPLSPACFRQILVVEDASETWALPEVLYRASPFSSASLCVVSPAAVVVDGDALAMSHMHIAVYMTCQ